MAHFLNPQSVQLFLDSLPPMGEFTVVFARKDGSQARYTGFLDPNGSEIPKLENIPFMLSDGAGSGWKQFNRGRVLWIDHASTDTTSDIGQ